MGKEQTRDNRHFFPLHRQLKILLAGNQFILCKEEVVAI